MHIYLLRAGPNTGLNGQCVGDTGCYEVKGEEGRKEDLWGRQEKQVKGKKEWKI